MEIQAGARVRTARDEEVGRVDRVVIDPGSLEITHLVVQKGFLLTTDKVIPAEWIASASNEEVVLKPDALEFDALPDFEETYYEPLARGEQDGPPLDDFMTRTYYFYPPVGIPPLGTTAAYRQPPMRSETERNIPDGTVALKEGAGVVDRDGSSVGSVERIFTETGLNQVTHFVISLGTLIKDRKLVPIHWVTRFEEDRVHLEVDKNFLDRLPSYSETS